MTNLSIIPETSPRMFSTTLETYSGFDAFEIKYLPGNPPILVSVHILDISENERRVITQLANKNEVVLKEIMIAIDENEQIILESMREFYGDDYAFEPNEDFS